MWGGGGVVYSILAMSLCVGGKVVYVLGGEVVYSMHTLHVGVVPISSPA